MGYEKCVVISSFLLLFLNGVEFETCNHEIRALRSYRHNLEGTVAQHLSNRVARNDQGNKRPEKKHLPTHFLGRANAEGEELKQLVSAEAKGGGKSNRTALHFFQYHHPFLIWLQAQY